MEDRHPLRQWRDDRLPLARSGGVGYGHQVADDIRYLSGDALAVAGDFAERYLRRYVTDAPVFAFGREIPEDQMKGVREYFTKGKLLIPGQEPEKKAPARRRK